MFSDVVVADAPLPVLGPSHAAAKGPALGALAVMTSNAPNKLVEGVWMRAGAGVVVAPTALSPLGPPYSNARCRSYAPISVAWKANAWPFPEDSDSGSGSDSFSESLPGELGCFSVTAAGDAAADSLL